MLTPTFDRLCDLRNVTSSAAMASELARHMCEAFNGGNVLPTGNSYISLRRLEAERLQQSSLFLHVPLAAEGR